jgi:hypothetical protein
MASHTDKHPTLIHTSCNHGADDQDVQFSERRGLTDAMRSGCLAAVHSEMVSGEGEFDLGFGERVRVSLDSYVYGRVVEVLGVIAYSDARVETLFFVFRDESGDLAAVMGSGKSVSCAIDGWLDGGRYRALAWDSAARSFRHIFPTNDFKTLWCDGDGMIAGADIEDTVMSVSKAFVYGDYARVPEAVLLRIGVQSEIYLAAKSAQGGMNGQ